MKLTEKQSRALALLNSEPGRGFDLAELARRLNAPPNGLSRTLGSLIDRGLVERYRGGVGRTRMHYQAVNPRQGHDATHTAATCAECRRNRAAGTLSVHYWEPVTPMRDKPPARA